MVINCSVFDVSRLIDACRKLVLQEDFPNIPRKYIDLRFKESGRFLTTYQALELASRTWNDTDNPPFAKLKKLRVLTFPQTDDLSWIDGMAPEGYGIEELKREIIAARRTRKKEESKQRNQTLADEAEAKREKEARDKGDVIECDICTDTKPFYKFVHCSGDVPHFSCGECLQNHVAALIGDQRYQLECLPDTSCKASYSRSQRDRFLAQKTIETLERLQQQAELKLANVENLASCPVCDYAAVYPKVEDDKEFRCENPDCQRVSCRLCQKDTHTPISCKEYKESFGVNERHEVEEAMVCTTQAF